MFRSHPHWTGGNDIDVCRLTRTSDVGNSCGVYVVDLLVGVRAEVVDAGDGVPEVNDVSIWVEADGVDAGSTGKWGPLARGVVVCSLDEND